MGANDPAVPALVVCGVAVDAGLSWTLLAALVTPTNWVAVSYLLAYVVLRFAMAWTVGVWGVGDYVLRKKMWLVPLRDAMHFLIWLASFGSNRIKWGTAEYLVHDGKMIPHSHR